VNIPERITQLVASAALEQSAEREADELRELEEARLRSWRRAFKDAVPIVDACEVFGELKPTDAMRAVSAWLPRATSRGLCVRGPVGCGKTTAALYAVRTWTEPRAGVIAGSVHSGHPVSWLNPDELVTALLHAYDRDAPRLHRHVVLDDLGRETKSDFAEALCRLLDPVDRSTRLPHVVLVTSNLTRDQMRQRYEPRVLDRLGHRCVAVDVTGPSLRRNGGF
jgi:DNA replication protein DnaC